MIDVTDQLIEVVGGIVGPTYRTWPQKAPARGTPYAVVDMVARVPEVIDADGSEIIVRLTYAVYIFASKPSQAADLAGEVVDAMAGLSFHTAGYSDTFEDPSKLYRVNLTLDGAVDRRGQSYR